MAAKFTCTVCYDDDCTGPQRTIDGSLICSDCTLQHIPPLFQRAFDNKGSDDYSPRWGVELQARDFLDVLGAEFVERYERVIREYNADLKIYCSHHMLEATAPARGYVAPAGQKLALTGSALFALPAGTPTIVCKAFVGAKSKTLGKVQTCYRCNGLVCVCCEMALEQARHLCQPRAEPTIEEIMGDKVRGRDYQACPQCGDAIELVDGCNSVTCKNCRTSLCFFCGKKVFHDSDHWKVSVEQGMMLSESADYLGRV